jgi:hypothetical protein
MSSSPSPKRSTRSSNSAPAKILITAASLVTMVGGWAALALQQSALNAQKNAAVSDDTSQFVLDLPPLPTLVPEPSSIPTGASPNPTVSPPLTFAPYNTAVVSTPVANPPLVTVPSGGNKNGAQKGTSGKAANKPAKDPVSHTGSSK